MRGEGVCKTVVKSSCHTIPYYTDKISQKVFEILKSKIKLVLMRKSFYHILLCILLL